LAALPIPQGDIDAAERDHALWSWLRGNGGGNAYCPRIHPDYGEVIAGLDHGVGHSLLVLCDANAHHGKKWNNFKVLENYLFNVSISLS